MVNCRITIREVVEDIAISVGLCYENFHIGHVTSHRWRKLGIWLWRRKQSICITINAPAHLLLFVRYFCQKQQLIHTLVFTGLDPMRLFPVLKTERIHEREEIWRDWVIKIISHKSTKSYRKSIYQKEDWKKVWMCIISERDYFEENKIMIDKLINNFWRKINLLFFNPGYTHF